VTPEKVAELVGRLKCPVEPDRNAEFRAKLLDFGGNDAVWAAQIKARCAADPVFWFNSTCYTQDPKWRENEPDVPLILYKKQVEYVNFRKQRRRLGKPHCFVKSREQGASIIFCEEDQHEWQFHGASVKIGSEKKDKVDSGSFATSLFPKIYYNLTKQPEFLLPAGFKFDKSCRKFCNIYNPETGKPISGEPTNEDFARGDRISNLDIDEASAIPILEQIHTACANATRCWAMISTPRGYEYFAKLVHGGRVDVFTMLWWENEAWHGWTDGLTGTKHDGLYTCKPGCLAHPDGGKPHSDRFDAECESYSWDASKIAQELDGDFAKSGGAIFNPDVIRRCATKLAQSPLRIQGVSLDWKDQTQVSHTDKDAWYRASRAWSVTAAPAPHSALRIWKEPFSCREKTCICEGSGRHVYTVGADIAKGLDHGDRSVAYALDITTAEVVAELCTNNTEPDDFAVLLMQMVKYYGKSSGCDINPFTTIEWNDQGTTVNKIARLMGLGQSQFWYVSDDKMKASKIADRPGNVIGPANRLRLLTEYLAPNVAKDMGDGYPLIVVPFPEFWGECEYLVRRTNNANGIGGDKPKVGRLQDKHDDRPFALLHAIFGAMFQYNGKIKNVIRRKWAPPGYERRLQMEKLEALRRKTGEPHGKRLLVGSALQTSLQN
jgi:hypothetical protein